MVMDLVEDHWGLPAESNTKAAALDSYSGPLSLGLMKEQIQENSAKVLSEAAQEHPDFRHPREHMCETCE